MPIIVNSENVHPFLPSLGSLSAIEKRLAERQEIRPLEIAILNLMADKRTTERQLASWLGRTPLQVRLTFATTDSYIRPIQNGREAKNTPSEHIRDFYSAWSDIKDRKFDGLVITGVNALCDRVEQEKIWGEVGKILEWSTTNVLSSLFLCWGAKAALKYFHDIDSIKQPQKIWGVYKHHVCSDRTDLLSGFSDVFDLPVSRWKTPLRKDIEAHKNIEIIADSKEAGPNILAEIEPTEGAVNFFPRMVYVLAHPEYDTDTLCGEYERDKKLTSTHRVPDNYFPDNDPSKRTLNTWRPCAHLYTNWVHAVYDATPYDLNQIPKPHRANEMGKDLRCH
ncbi:MAG: homoserine O-succinyltransferase [Alphaproteobacteria bacterium]|nr:homoserine O-succinyltransferase [Alphaproteobacteria bacterium]